MKKLFIILALLLLISAPVNATTYYIDCANGGTGDGSIGDPWGTFAEFETEGDGVVTGNDTVKINGECAETILSKIPANFMACDASWNASIGGASFTGASGSVIATTIQPVSGKTGARSFTGFIFDDTNVSDSAVSTTVLLDPTTSTASPVTFTNCTFQASQSGTYECSVVLSTATDWGSAINISGCTFDNMEFPTAGSSSTYGAIFMTGTSASSLNITNGTTINIDSGIPVSAIYLSSNGVSVAGCSFAMTDSSITTSVNTYSSYGGLIYVRQGGHTSLTIDGCTVTNNKTDSTVNELIYFEHRQNDIDAITITDNAFYQNSTANCSSIVIQLHTNAIPASGLNIARNNLYTKSSGGYGIGIIATDSNSYNKCDGAIIEHNIVYGPAWYNAAESSSQLHGIFIGWNKKGYIRYNFTNGCWLGCGVKSTGESGESADWEHIGGMYGNIIYNADGGESAMGIMIKGSVNVPAYNNIVYNQATQNTNINTGISAGCDVEAGCDQFATGAWIKNNIIVLPDKNDDNEDTELISISTDCDTNAVISNNLYYNYSLTDNTYSFLWDGVSKTGWSEWSAASGDTNSGFLDPLFTNADNLIFTLQASSPGVYGGVDMGLTTDYEGHTIPRGSAPTLGVYEQHQKIIGF